MDPGNDGDVRLTVGGSFDAQGTLAQPIVITSAAESPAPGDWDRLELNGPATLVHTVVEYATVGVDFAGAGARSLTSVTIADTSSVGLEATGGVSLTASDLAVTAAGAQGIYASGSTLLASDVTVDACTDEGVELVDCTADLDGLIASANGSHGVHARGGDSLTLTNATLEDNVGAGARVDDTAADIDHCDILSNGLGVQWIGTATGNLTWSDVKLNEREGLLFVSDAGNPSPAIHNNNIYSNATVEGGVAASAGLSVSTTSGDYLVKNSAPWSTPGGQDILLAQVAYSETGSSVQGYVKSAGGSVLKSYSSNFGPAFQDLTGDQGMGSGISSILLSVDDSSYSYSGAMSIGTVYYRKAGAVSEISVMTDAGTIDATQNYWGVFPNVLSVAVLGRPDSINMNGFVGFDFFGTGPQ
jgi:hypothetical protein